LYHRLNEDYRPLHALCRFFLEQTGPLHALGDRQMLPFLVDMARLYELFVAEWLSVHLPETLKLKAQERVTIGQSHHLKFDIDLVLYDAKSDEARCVLDTKYKAPGTPANDDIFQVVAYAEAKGCRQAVLVYPTPLAQPLDETIGRIRVRSLTFGLDGNLEAAGRQLLAALAI
ncbi:MAG: restriction endonuclease, partial [Anaerolineae bacterium]|nr:restriction endonuclease [Anaerolineae bacterium]